jgi:hypothetical protein
MMEMLISIDDLKHHLSIEQGFTDDDGYLESLILTAQEYFERRINRRLTDHEPYTVLHGIKIIAADFYMNRESVSFGSPSRIPDGLDLLEFYDYS